MTLLDEGYPPNGKGQSEYYERLLNNTYRFPRNSIWTPNDFLSSSHLTETWESSASFDSSKKRNGRFDYAYMRNASTRLTPLKVTVELSLADCNFPMRTRQ